MMVRPCLAALSQEAQAGLRQDLESLYVCHNAATDGTTVIAAEYLGVVATRSRTAGPHARF